MLPRMATESSFVEVAQKVAENILLPPLFVLRGAALLYQVTVDNQLLPTVDLKRPVRGNSAFQTDLCIFEKKSEDVSIPRVVMEFKTRITTHDVLTYSAKATKHKQVYSCSPAGKFHLRVRHNRQSTRMLRDKTAQRWLFLR